MGTLPLVTAVVEVYAEGAMGTEKYFCVAVTTYSDTTFSDEDSLYLQAGTYFACTSFEGFKGLGLKATDTCFFAVILMLAYIESPAFP